MMFLCKQKCNLWCKLIQKTLEYACSYAVLCDINNY